MRALILALVLVWSAAGQMSMTVDQLKQFIHSSFQRKYPDKQVARYIKLSKLTEQLSDRDLLALINEAPGTETAEALKQLADQSKRLAPPAEPPEEAKPARAVKPPPPAPALKDQERIIEEAREVALSYTKKLPDFICLQYTRRLYDRTGSGDFHQYSTIAERLSYFEQHEDYKFISVNGDSPVTPKSREMLGGAISSGEFGTMMREIFEPQTATEFHFERWGKWNGHVSYVYGYHVDKENSRWTIDYEHGAQTYRPAYHGLIYIERDAPVVIRLTLEAEGIPATFPIHAAQTSLDYEYQNISGQKFLLPASSEMIMRDSRATSKNEVEFRSYSKYSAETLIKYDTDAAASASPAPPGRTSLTVAQLKQYVHSAIEAKTPDKQTAQHLQECQLTERLTDNNLLEMINDGAGSQTIDTLKQMQEQSMSLPLPAAPKP
ncbi:MAG: hypothetical protein ACLQBJ_08455 [Bryobacteraceae bacterium]